MNLSPVVELTENHSDASLAPQTRVAKVLQSVPIGDTLAEFLTLPVFASPSLPESHIDIAVFRVAMNLQLFCDFSARCLSVEKQLSTENLVIPESLRPKWDTYLLKEAAVQKGAAILLSDLVVARVWAWAHGEREGSWAAYLRISKNLQRQGEAVRAR